MGKREERIYEKIQNPKSLADYALIEGKNSNRAKTTKRGQKYRWLLPSLVLIAAAGASLVTVLTML